MFKYSSQAAQQLNIFLLPCTCAFKKMVLLAPMAVPAGITYRQRYAPVAGDNVHVIACRSPRPPEQAVPHRLGVCRHARSRRERAQPACMPPAPVRVGPSPLPAGHTHASTSGARSPVPHCDRCPTELASAGAEAIVSSSHTTSVHQAASLRTTTSRAPRHGRRRKSSSIRHPDAAQV